jgi:nucleoside-diphosphate-sugar epimerase
MSGIDYSGTPVLVTGGGGFIGSHLVDALLERGARVRVLDNFATGHRRNLAHTIDRVELLEGDIRDAATCREACAGNRIVFHEAALGSVPRSMRDPATTMDVNVRGTANVFAACRDAGVQRVVYASSSSVYGDSRTLPKKEGEEGRPLSPYALSKAMNEQLAELFGRVFPGGPSFIGLRYFNVFGPRQDPAGPYAAVVPRFIAAVREGRPPVIYGNGEQSRDFTFVSDVVNANLLAALAPGGATGRAYNVAPGGATTVSELAKAVIDAFGGGPPPVHEGVRPGDILHSRADSSAAKEWLGFEAGVELFEGLRQIRAARIPEP